MQDGHENKKAIESQTKLFSDFIKLGDWTIKTSKLRTRIEKIKVDDNKYDTAIIVSSDTDLIPAIDWVRKRLKKRVEYVGFSIAQTSDFEATRPTKTMIYNSDIQRVLVEIDIHPFIKKNLFTSD